LAASETRLHLKPVRKLHAAKDKNIRCSKLLPEEAMEENSAKCKKKSRDRSYCNSGSQPFMVCGPL